MALMEQTAPLSSGAAAWATSTGYDPLDAVSNDGSSYICTGTHTSGATTEPGVGADWATVWDLMAAKGETGPQGEQGLQGVQGETRAQGIQGETGPQGIQGETGLTGAAGADGVDGADGAQGIQGPAGAAGPDLYLYSLYGAF